MLRIGLMLPSSNTVMEPDFVREFAGRATIHAARMFLEDPVTTEGEERMLDEGAEPAARDLGTLEPDLVVFGCTSAGALRGAEADRKLRATLSDLAGAPVVGIVDSIARSLRGRGMERVSVFTPYSDDLNRVIARGLDEDGFDVLSIEGLGNADNVAIGRVGPEHILDRGADAVAKGSEALVVPCTNFRAFEVRDELAEKTGVEVITACSAVIESIGSEL
ncbi:MAG: maleate cis-trans isomerase family protein [Solirubrobacterales bacterium]